MNLDRHEPTAVMKDARIGRRAALLLTLGCIVAMALPLSQQMLASGGPSLISKYREDAQKFGIELMLRQVEHHLVYDSQFAASVRQPYQRVLIRAFGQGSRTVIVGQRRMLFYRPELPGIAGPGILSPAFLENAPQAPDIVEAAIRNLERRLKGQPPQRLPVSVPPVDSITSIASLDAAFRSRGVHLVLLIVPGKTTIYPERLSPAYPVAAGPAWNTDYASWKQRLTGAGVDFVDLSEAFWAARNNGAEPLFLAEDSHWTPRGVALAAAEVSGHVRSLVDGPPLARVTGRAMPVPEPTDLLMLLGLRQDAVLFPPRSITVTAVTVEGDGDPTGDDAPVLLIGDSLSGYYDEQQAGLAWQLMLRMRVGVQRMIGFGDEEIGVIETAIANPAVLAHKKVVVLECGIGKIYGKRFSTLWPAAR
jgi:hypothetical protein